MSDSAAKPKPLYFGIVLDKAATKLSVAAVNEDWQKAYESCKKQFPDKPCLCVDIVTDAAKAREQLLEFFIKNGMSQKDATDAAIAFIQSVSQQFNKK